jgi:subtilisin family serine protease
MHVLVQVRPTELPMMTFEATVALEAPPVDLEALANVGFVHDVTYAPVIVPAVRAPVAGGLTLALGHQPELSFEAADVSSLVRGTIPDGDEQTPVVGELLARPEVMGVFADPVVEPMLTCVGDPPVGDDTDVARLLDCAQLHADGFTGENVRVAVVDSGIDAAYLASRGRTNRIDVPNSFTSAAVPGQPGAHSPGHGTMCSFDVGIAAPEAVLLDHAILPPGGDPLQSLLSDAVLSFSQMRALLLGEDGAPLVVNNSWGVFNPATDFPAGHPGNYTDNPGHPFNLIVASLESAGADILFAAGNCGVECPDGRCRFQQMPISGANAHPAVLSVAGIDVNGARVGYSSQGPGRIGADKPDICSYTHFKGSEVFGPGKPDSGTSTACPVAAGVVAAIRTRVPRNALTPAQLRALVQRTATDLGHVGFDHDHGWGALTPSALVAALP